MCVACGGPKSIASLVNWVEVRLKIIPSWLIGQALIVSSPVWLSMFLSSMFDWTSPCSCLFDWTSHFCTWQNIILLQSSERKTRGVDAYFENRIWCLYEKLSSQHVNSYMTSSVSSRHWWLKPHDVRIFSAWRRSVLDPLVFRWSTSYVNISLRMQ